MHLNTAHEKAFIRELERQQISPRTIDSYVQSLGQFTWWLRQFYGDEFLDPKAVTAHDTRAYRQFLLKERRLKPATINRMLAALSRFFAFAQARKWTRLDPTQGVKGVRRERRTPKALDSRSLRKLLRSCYQRGRVRDIAIVELLINTGIRVGELVHLNAADLSLSPRKGRLLVRGKGETFRTLALNNDARRALAQYLSVRPEVVTTALFLSQRHTRFNESSIWRLVRKYGKQSDVEVTPHVLRHTFATRLVREHKVDMATVAQLMGHEDVNTTAIYSQPTEADLEEAVGRLELEGEDPTPKT